LERLESEAQTVLVDSMVVELVVVCMEILEVAAEQVIFE
jgi:hypothetical protein